MDIEEYYYFCSIGSNTVCIHNIVLIFFGNKNLVNHTKTFNIIHII